MSHKLIVTVFADGRIESRTSGVYGNDCVADIAILEDLLASTSVDSRYTSDFEATAAVNADREQVTLGETETHP